ncbi:MAG TPA: hypothetical protein VKR58_07215 [Aquella sp.]|nr:hypothetical protein [Aquella sp.]
MEKLFYSVVAILGSVLMNYGLGFKMSIGLFGFFMFIQAIRCLAEEE